MIIIKLKKIISSVLSTAIVTNSVAAALFLQPNNLGAYAINFDEGNYSIWDGTTYTFDWYTSPSVVDGVTTYTITQASDLAGLAVLTNDLSSSEWNTITAGISETQYISQVETFKNSVIKLSTDIDLASMNWLPISYPWDTPNLTAQYDIHTPEGNIVKYNAVDYIPDDTVDPWVGDENGDPISTRYWEYPESELRFRDLTKSLVGSGAHSLYQTTKDMELTPFMMYTSACNEHYAREQVTLPLTGVTHQNFDETDIIVNYDFKSIKGYTSNPGFEGVFDGDGHNIKGVSPKTPWTEDTTQRLTTYDPIAKGLFGMLADEGAIKNVNVKGSYDNEVVSYSAILCAWNYGTIENCYVEGDMNQALIEMIYPINRDYGSNGTSVYKLSDTAGTVMPVGNSGFLTAQNYGTISNCYTVGEVTQAFRQFGFFASNNYGVIRGCENRANFSTQYVETDFITDEWDFNLDEERNTDVTDYVFIGPNFCITNGAIAQDVANGIDKGDVMGGVYKQNLLTSPQIIINDITASLSLRSNYSGSVTTYSLRKDDYSSAARTKGLASCFNIITSDDLHTYSSNLTLAAIAARGLMDGEYYSETCGCSVDGYVGSSMSAAGMNTTLQHSSNITFINSFKCPSASGYQSDMWVPAQYLTNEGESVAANHLYGVYQQTVVGGIAAVNYNTIDSCSNSGNIEAMYNTSPRNNFDTEDISDEPTRHGYSYIRPNNSYSLFVTATNTNTVAGGIVGINIGSLLDVENTGSINRRSESEQEAHTTFEGTRNDMIMATRNGFYQNGVLMDAETAEAYIDQWERSIYFPFDLQQFNGKCYTNWGFGWYITEDTLSEHLAECSCDDEDCAFKYTEDLFDRNMPYPFVVRENCKLYQNVAGICPMNTNVIDGAKHTGYSEYCISKLSIGTSEDAKIQDAITEITIENDALVYGIVFDIARDTDILNTESTIYSNFIRPDDSEDPVYEYRIPTATGNRIYGDSRKVNVENIKVFAGIGAFGYGENASITNVVIYDTDNYSQGICERGTDVDITNAFVYQNCNSACGTLNGQFDLTNIYAFGDNKYAFVQGDVNGTWLNLQFYGPHCEYLIQSSGVDDSEIKTVRAYPLTDTFGKTDKGSQISNVKISDVELFLDCNLHMLDMYNCNIENVNIYGSTDHIDNSTENVINMSHCNVKNFLSQLQVDIDVINYRDTFRLQNLPGVLKAQRDTNTFENVVIMTPAGLASYPTINSADDFDTTILTDASLINDANARISGSLAYYMDKGNKIDRTYQWTVVDDVIIDVLPDDCIVDTSISGTPESITLPTHTRKLLSEDRTKAFYRFNIPNSAAGFGEIKGTNVRGDLTQQTDLTGLYDQTALFLHEGENISLNTTSDNTHALIGMTKATLKKTESIPSDDKPTAPYKHNEEIMPAYDVELIGIWSGVHSIEIDPDIGTWLSLEPTTYGAATNQVIELSGFLQDPSVSLTDIYYCEYILDSNNKFVLDRENKHSIDMSTLSFEMPDANIQISASYVNDVAEITRFVLAGTDGVIDGDKINVQLDSSVDISNIAPDLIAIPSNATITPAITEPQNFLQEVKYVVKAPSGKSTTYFVTVTPVTDGEITRFNVLGFDAEITDSEIKLTVPVDLDVTNVTPLIVWSGISITPDLSSPMDLTTEGITFTVESSQGESKTYSFELIRDEHAADPSEIVLKVDDTPLQISIDYDNHIISVTYPFGIDVSEVEIEGLNVVETEDILPGSKLNLTKHNNIVLRTPNGSTSMFKVIAIEQKDIRKEITQFTLFGYNGVIDNNNHTILVELPSKYDIKNIAPDVIAYLGKEVTEMSDRKDFTQNVEYTVIAYDGSFVTYTVTVSRIS